VNEKPDKLIAEVNYSADCLLLYRAELGRILGLKCDEVSDSGKLDTLLKSNKTVRQQAERFVLFARLLEEKCTADGSNMLNWFRTDHKQLKTSPFYAIIDERRLEEVIGVLQ
jgi:hypothetical protein